MISPNELAELEPEADAHLVAILAQQAITPQLLEEGVYLVRNGEGEPTILTTPAYQDELAEGPRFIERGVQVIDSASFLDYIAENCTAEGAHGASGRQLGSLEVWADAERGTVRAILDGYDGWRKHTCTLKVEPEPSWLEWLAIDGKLLDQVAFAEFIEDHLSTIAKPDGAKLLEICQTMTGHTNLQWRSQSILQNGQRQFQWEENVEAKAGDKGQLVIPEHLTLALAPYKGTPPVAIRARFRYRLRAGDLSIGVKLEEPRRCMDAAFAALTAEISAALPEGIRIRNGRC